MKASSFFPLVAVWCVVFCLPAELLAQSTNVRPPNRNQATRFKSAIFRGSGNFIQSNSVASFIGGGQSNVIFQNAQNGVIAGGFGNVSSNNFATVSGGISNFSLGVAAVVAGGMENKATDGWATVSGGYSNSASGAVATIGGGQFNTASGGKAFVGGGDTNTASGGVSTVAGGARNAAGGNYATVTGGFSNVASGSFSTIGGGRRNTISEDYATVPGGSLCEATNIGSFVWSGWPFQATSSWGDYTFTVRAHGGARFYTAAGTGTYAYLAPGSGTWTAMSDRDAKENFGDVNASEVLAKVAALPIKTWNYKTQADNIKHIGPTAQDFKEAFGVGESDTGITTVDADGVALAAIQGLVEGLKERDKAIEELQYELRAVKERLNSLPPAP